MKSSNKTPTTIQTGSTAGKGKTPAQSPANLDKGRQSGIQTGNSNKTGTTGNVGTPGTSGQSGHK